MVTEKFLEDKFLPKGALVKEFTAVPNDDSTRNCMSFKVNVLYYNAEGIMKKSEITIGRNLIIKYNKDKKLVNA